MTNQSVWLWHCWTMIVREGICVFWNQEYDYSYVTVIWSFSRLRRLVTLTCTSKVKGPLWFSTLTVLGIIGLRIEMAGTYL